MEYINNMKIKIERKEDVKKALEIIKEEFKTGNFYADYNCDLPKRIINDLKVDENIISLGNDLDGYFTPEDSRNVFETVIKNLASIMTLINFEADVRNLGSYSSSRITAQFVQGSLKIQNEYWSGLDEDGESELNESSYYFF